MVLDSNIWVDLLVFQDPHVAPIRAALDAGTIAPVIRADCREELRRVLAYPHFARFSVDIDAALAQVDRLATLEPAPDQTDFDAVRLPKCRDTDDQKFIELAHFARRAAGLQGQGRAEAQEPPAPHERRGDPAAAGFRRLAGRRDRGIHCRRRSPLK